jgi:aryl-alcohol dehydrogenase-like predicted oxidoreductase
MEMSQLGGRGLWVTSLSFGTLTFGGKGDGYDAIGSTDPGSTAINTAISD